MKKRKTFFLHLGISLLFGIISLIFFQWFFYVAITPEMTFSDGTLIKLGETYNMSDYKVTYLGKDITTKVIVENNVDITKVGKYVVTYTVKIGDKEYVKQRIVEVVDAKQPVITLKGKTNVITCPLDEYVEEGYTAIDDYNGDVTGRVKVTVSKGQILYTVDDLSGNISSTTRLITYEDKTSPVIKLKGSSKLNLYVGFAYNEAGYTASDNCDGNLNSKVTVSGSVNNKKIGTYKIKYSVEDEIGLKTEVTRTIAVIAKPNNSGKTIYLTFDDGPGSATETILDILKDEGVKATFFVTGRSGYDSLIKRAYNEGHTVALHCYSHYYQVVYASDQAYFNDLAKINNKVKSLIGIESKILRFPGGSSNSVSANYSIGIMTRLTAEVTRRGYRYYDWNVASSDTVNIGSDQVFRNVTSRLSSGSTSVVLMHDGAGNWQTANALRRIIQYGKEMGYSFNKITSSTPQIKHRVVN